MSTEREDPTDVGLSRVWSRDELEVLRAQWKQAQRERRRQEAQEPSGPPASGRMIERSRAAHGFPRSRNTARLLARCTFCGAAPRAWCRSRPGFLHDGRGSDETPG